MLHAPTPSVSSGASEYVLTARMLDLCYLDSNSSNLMLHSHTNFEVFTNLLCIQMPASVEVQYGIMVKG